MHWQEFISNGRHSPPKFAGYLQKGKDLIAYYKPDLDYWPNRKVLQHNVERSPAAKPKFVDPATIDDKTSEKKQLETAA